MADWMPIGICPICRADYRLVAINVGCWVWACECPPVRTYASTGTADDLKPIPPPPQEDR